MKQIFSKMKESWSNFTSDHSRSSKLLVASGATGVGGTAATGWLGWAAMTSSAGPGTYGAWAALGGAIVLETAILATAGILAVAGIGFFLYERQKNKATETVTNAAGQKVQGPRWALNRLAKADKQINKLTSAFNGAAAMPEDVQKRVALLIERTVAAQQNVTVLEAVSQGAAKDKYQFAGTKTPSAG